MTQLHTLIKIKDNKKKRPGRGYGSGIGAKSGRGTTRHQAARTNIPLHFEGGQNKITKKFPLLRGKGRNKSVQEKPLVINLSKLSSLKANSVVDIDMLVKEKIVDERAYTRGVKILAQGSLEVSLQVALPMSDSAREKVEKAGGKIIVA